MSTAADILDELQERLPPDKTRSLFPALNRAIKILHKRLFVLGSDMVIGELATPVYASVSYAAATIAFVSGGDAAQDTITDSDAQFVIEGFEAGMPIYTTCSGNTNDVCIDSVVAGTITLRSGDKVSAQAAGSSYTITSRDHYGYLPTDFWGLVTKPYIVGKKYELEPLPSQAMKIYYSSSSGVSTGTPLYYKIIGNQIHLVPAAASDITIAGDYWKKPTTITDTDAVLPFDELFDDVIIEYLLKVLGGGSAAVGDVAGMLVDAVDLIVPKRQKSAPVKIPEGINWGDLHE